MMLKKPLLKTVVPKEPALEGQITKDDLIDRINDAELKGLSYKDSAEILGLTLNALNAGRKMGGVGMALRSAGVRRRGNVQEKRDKEVLEKMEDYERTHTEGFGNRSIAAAARDIGLKPGQVQSFFSRRRNKKYLRRFKIIPNAGPRYAAGGEELEMLEDEPWIRQVTDSGKPSQNVLTEEQLIERINQTDIRGLNQEETRKKLRLLDQTVLIRTHDIMKALADAGMKKGKGET